MQPPSRRIRQSAALEGNATNRHRVAGLGHSADPLAFIPVGISVAGAGHYSQRRENPQARHPLNHSSWLVVNFLQSK